MDLATLLNAKSTISHCPSLIKLEFHGTDTDTDIDIRDTPIV